MCEMNRWRRAKIMIAATVLVGDCWGSIMKPPLMGDPLKSGITLAPLSCRGSGSSRIFPFTRGRGRTRQNASVSIRTDVLPRNPC